ncbi:hypothetical protein [Glutamicibacter sp. TV12E]|uniref:hypothetical protein n=1 Tax=Glutamicibacter sp. TV12E TaxID=3446362 RepID=UPI004034CEF0
MSQDFWLGILTIPLLTAAGYGILLAVIGFKYVAGKAFSRMIMIFPAIREGGDVGANFPLRTLTDFGHRSAFAAIALSARKMILFEPFGGLGFFIMIGSPFSNNKQARRARRAIEEAYDKILEQDQEGETNSHPDKEPTHE